MTPSRPRSAATAGARATAQPYGSVPAVYLHACAWLTSGRSRWVCFAGRRGRPHFCRLPHSRAANFSLEHLRRAISLGLGEPARVWLRGPRKCRSSARCHAAARSPGGSANAPTPAPVRRGQPNTKTRRVSRSKTDWPVQRKGWPASVGLSLWARLRFHAGCFPVGGE